MVSRAGAVETGHMQNTYPNTKNLHSAEIGGRPPLRRLSGPVGGVSAGLARTLGVDATAMRLAVALAVVFTGPVALVAYTLAWLVIPVDPAVPIDRRPSKAPVLLLAAVVLVLGVGFAIDLLTFFPASWLVAAAIVGWYLWHKNR